MVISKKDNPISIGVDYGIIEKGRGLAMSKRTDVTDKGVGYRAPDRRESTRKAAAKIVNRDVMGSALMEEKGRPLDAITDTAFLRVRKPDIAIGKLIEPTRAHSQKPEFKAHDDNSIFDDAEALIALAQESFKSAAQKAVAENDALGIPTHGSVNGKLVVRMPKTIRPTK
ncbi:MAG: hypothetical protein L7F77_13225 [Candidatus Magnetominusculus sp. LBB02]|nr:hypothetical protein [Candidatus Magnetominusculus sp. LBB02]